MAATLAACFLLVLSAASSAGGAADEGVCQTDNAQAGCGVSLVMQQPGKSLLPFVADEVRAVCVWRGGGAAVRIGCASAARRARA